MSKDLNLRESLCPLCNSVIFMHNLNVTAAGYSFDLKCCGVDCNYSKHVIRGRRDRKQD